MESITEHTTASLGESEVRGIDALNAAIPLVEEQIKR